MNIENAIHTKNHQYSNNPTQPAPIQPLPCITQYTKSKNTHRPSPTNSLPIYQSPRASGLPTLGAHCRLFLLAAINLSITLSSFFSLNQPMFLFPFSCSPSSSSKNLFTGA